MKKIAIIAGIILAAIALFVGIAWGLSFVPASVFAVIFKWIFIILLIAAAVFVAYYLFSNSKIVAGIAFCVVVAMVIFFIISPKWCCIVGGIILFIGILVALGYGMYNLFQNNPILFWIIVAIIVVILLVVCSNWIHDYRVYREWLNS